ncbi:MAG: Mur ligase family protein [Hyphomonadaceae bacterium]
MSPPKSYFFCGVGGSGMLPLALIVKARGAEVMGSDRSLDQGRTGDKFAFLRARGIPLFAQDGSGLTRADQILVASAAVEKTIPDVQKAIALGAPMMTRAALLAELFNAAKTNIAVGGTSGKSTTTGMIGWILAYAGRDPTIMNGAVMKNFMSADAPFASALVGDGDLFVAEVDESDGSIAGYDPRIAVLNNISLDHKSMEELRQLFGDFVAKAEVAVLNIDNEETARIANAAPAGKIVSYSLSDANADLRADKLTHEAAGVSFDAIEKKTGARRRIAMKVPGAHNAANALAAIGAVRALGVSLDEAGEALAAFSGIRRRLEFVGTANGVTIIDDFAHNPDKIEATLTTLHAAPGRLLILFQAHGYGPLRLMKEQFIDTFARDLAAEDVLAMPKPAYFGGTTDMSVTSEHIIEGVASAGRKALYIEDRAQCAAHLLSIAKSGDRIVIMGARDDTLSELAASLVARLENEKAPA